MLLGVDLGTGSCKIMVLDPINYKVRGEVVNEYSLLHPHLGWAEHNPKCYIKAVSDGIKKVMKVAHIEKDDIEAICIVSPRDSLIAIDKQGKNLVNCITWIDQRALQEEGILKKELNLEEVIKITGSSIDYSFWAAKILWLKREKPETFKKIKYFLNPANYLAFQMANSIALHPSGATRTMLFDINKLEWCKEICDVIGISIDTLPHIEKRIKIIGEITQDAAKIFHLKKGTPVAVVCGDDPVAALAGGSIDLGFICISAATNDVIYSPLKRPTFDLKGRMECTCHVIENTWLFEASINAGGGSLRWFKDTFTPYKSYSYLDSIAEKVSPGANGLLYYPYLWGARVPKFNPLATGVFFGVTNAHTLGHFVRAIMEGVALQYIEALEIIKEFNIHIEKLSLVGGGSKSKLWNMIKSCIINKNILVPNISDVTVLGAAIIAGIATNLFKFKNLDTVIHKSWGGYKIFKPNEETYKKYLEIYKRWNSIYKKLDEAWYL